MHYLTEIIQIVRAAEAFGIKKFGNGAIYYGAFPEVGDEAFFHKWYPALHEEEVDTLEEDLGRSIPEAFREFLLMANGATLFRGNLALLGRFDATLIGSGMPQPFSLTDLNQWHRPAGTPTEILYVGAYTADSGGFLALDCVTGEAVFSTRIEFRILKRWRTFQQAFLSEVKRLRQFYDDKGMLLREDKSLLPAAT